jgi:hypothetical protein
MLQLNVNKEFTHIGTGKADSHVKGCEEIPS